MIYLLEDDDNIRDFTTYALKSSGMEVQGFALPSQFRAAMAKQLPQLVLLDIMLPEEDGLSILRWLKESEATAHLPVIMLTAKSTEYDKVLGLDSGADDYVAKPFGVMELLSRIRAVLRRAAKPIASDLLQMGTVALDSKRHTVTVAGALVALTCKEFDLLELLMRNQGLVMSRDRILQSVWGYDYVGESRTVDVHIRMLRAKLGDGGNIIETVRGVGYCCNADGKENRI